MRPSSLQEREQWIDVGRVNSGMSKTAVNYLVKQLHLEHASEGLITIAINPGWVDTDMVRPLLLPHLTHR